MRRVEGVATRVVASVGDDDMIDALLELAAYPGMAQILGGALTAVGTVSAVVWSGLKQASAERNRSKAHALNFVLQAQHISFKLGELVIQTLGRDDADDSEIKEAGKLEEDVAKLNGTLSLFPVHELPLKVVPAAHDLQQLSGALYLHCRAGIKGDARIDNEFRATAFALLDQAEARLSQISRYSHTKLQSDYYKEYEKKKEAIQKQLDREEEELRKEQAEASARTASASRRWWPF